MRKLSYVLSLYTVLAALIIAAVTYLTIYTEYNDKPILKVKFLNQWPGFTLDQLPMINETLTEKYNVKVVKKNHDVLIDGVFGDVPIDKDDDSIKIFFTGEARKHRVDGYDISIGFEYINKPNYMRIPLYYMYYGSKISTEYDRGTCNPNKQLFTCFLFSNGGTKDPQRFDGCTERNKLFHKLSEYKKVSSGGKYLNNIGHVITKEQTMEWLAQCKFIIAYENQSYEGYITEKPFQAYFAGSVPLYYSDPSAMADINPKAVIYQRDYSSQDEMVEYIKKLDNDDKLYCDVWNEKLVIDHDRNYEAVKAKLKEKLAFLLYNHHK